MPDGTAHKVNDQFQSDQPTFTDDQFAELTSILAAQHDEIKALVKPIHDIAILLLADRNGDDKHNADGDKPDPDDEKKSD